MTATIVDGADEQEQRARACRLCGSHGRLLYPDMSDRHFGAPGNFSLLECPSCELVWLHPKPERAQLAELYETYYTHEDAEAQSWLHRMVRVEIPATIFGYGGGSGNRVDRWLARLLSWLGPTRQLAQGSVMWLPARLRGRLLDVGCGSGAFLSHMQKLGWQVAGVEPDPKGAQQARKLLGITEVYEDVAGDELAADSFDAVTLSHVAEHLLDPDEILRGCLRVLKPGGRLVVTTPNAASLGRRCFGRNWIHWDPPRHIQLFTIATLEQTVERSGFKVISASTPSSSAHFVWQMSLKIRAEGTTTGLRVEQPSTSLLLGSVLFLAGEYLLSLIGLHCGEELLITAEKPGTSAAASP